MEDNSVATTPAAVQSRVARLPLQIGLATCFAALTAIAAHVRLPLPFTPVPVTLQTFVVLVAGGLLGAGLGALAQVEYLLAALIGLPVMTGLTLLSPTGGYVVGFVLAALIMGFCASRGSSLWLIIGVLGATLAIYTCGALWLSHYLGQGLDVTLALGVAPFLAGDALKAAAAVVVIKIGRRHLAAWL